MVVISNYLHSSTTRIIFEKIKLTVVINEQKANNIYIMNFVEIQPLTSKGLNKAKDKLATKREIRQTT